MDPHGMGGIGEPAVGESVGGEKVAELVMSNGLRNAENRYESDANSDDA